MSSSEMLAAVVPSVNAKWEIKQVSTPQPGANQVLIKIHASGICYTDVHATKGALGVKFPYTIGHEPAGEVVEVGEDVATRKVGDRVGVPWLQSTCGRCEWCQRGKSFFCSNHIATGINIPGGHAQYIVAYADATQLIPNGLSYEQAAPIFCAGYTVFSGLRLADPKPHERVAVVGIGALGHLGIQYSKAAGFETVAVTHSKDKEELAYKLGSDHVVSDGEALLKDGEGVDVILATSNSYKATADAIKGIRPDGRIILMGVSSTETLAVSPEILFKRARIIGSTQNDREHLYEALDYVAKGKVRVMTETFPLAEISNAYDKVANGNVRFKAVIEPIK
ncbi:MAG TPA: alcohol dehydrogenase catalytic domain-containing protein [Nitrososphaeraceae archaeon]|nr:alcohol dehydrogenase catalytic domain-containing protein [Nitrososphaeraceae archaeon]